jgi:hypothetical protein
MTEAEIVNPFFAVRNIARLDGSVPTTCSEHYPKYYQNIKSLTNEDSRGGTYKSLVGIIRSKSGIAGSFALMSSVRRVTSSVHF